MVVLINDLCSTLALENIAITSAHDFMTTIVGFPFLIAIKCLFLK